jgi:hypothetical protein
MTALTAAPFADTVARVREALSRIGISFRVSGPARWSWLPGPG